jgi:hypothetical protein
LMAEQFVEDFHGVSFSGLIRGAVKLYLRSAGWRYAEDAPRPIPVAGTEPPNGMAQVEIIAIVPKLGLEFARAVEDEPSRGESIPHCCCRGSALWPGLRPSAIAPPIGIARDDVWADLRTFPVHRRPGTGRSGRAGG